MNEQNLMRSRSVMALGILGLMLAGCAATPSTPVAQGPEEFFATPEQAATALVEANRANDKMALLAILGPNATKLVSSGDAIADKENREKFVKAYDQDHKFENSTDDQITLLVGEEEWPMPIPLVQIPDQGWQFDTEKGEQEILNRRIGRNELNAIKICRVYVEAQRDYAADHHTSKGAAEYAQNFVSSKGKHDGLYWPTKAGESPSPFGPLIANARAEGYHAGAKQNSHQPYHGYFYKILTAQGENAPGGLKNYMSKGHMTGGFALIALPAKYEDSGVMSFIVDQNGIVFEKNLGPDTMKVAMKMRRYDPDASWEIVTTP